MPRKPPVRRRVCFVTGTRAEFGLMQKTLDAIRRHPKLQLQVIATGMHLDARRGLTLIDLQTNWKIDRVVHWSDDGTSAVHTATATGFALAELARAFSGLKSEIVLVVGDRVEAFAAASAAHVAGLIVAHVHGGDRALGIVDDSLRHAITKLSHVHFAATTQSAGRIVRLGEDRWRVHHVGAPGIDGIRQSLQRNRSRRQRFALLVLHPSAGSEHVEQRRAELVLDAVRAIPFNRIEVVLPNNDPGSAGILEAWSARRRSDPRLTFHPSLPRGKYLGMLSQAAVLVGNSSSGIIEAASFGTPVIDIGDRQLGRERSANVVHVPYEAADLRRALAKAWNNGRPRRSRAANVYGGEGTARKIATILANLRLDDRTRRKIIAY